MRRAVLFLVVLASTLTFAGVTFTSVSKTEQDGRTSQTKVKAYVSGAHAKIEFLENENDQVFTPGKYLISRDGGKTMSLVDPVQKTVSPVDFEAMAREVKETMQRLHVKTTVGMPEMKRDLTEPGEKVAGMTTRHYRYLTTYTTTIEVLGQKTPIKTTITDDLWTTKEITDPAVGIWLKKQTPSTGDPNADALLKSEMSKLGGFPVKRITKTETMDDHGHHTVSTTSMEVTEAKVMPVPEKTFIVPQTYRVVPLPTPEEEDEADLQHPHSH